MASEFDQPHPQPEENLPIGEVALGSTIHDTPTPDEREQNIEKAHEQALASNDGRTKESLNRYVSRLNPSKRFDRDEASRYGKHLDIKVPRFQGASQREKLYGEFNDKLINEAREDILWTPDSNRTVEKYRDQNAIADDLLSPDKRADAYSKQAEQLEEFAALLYENPISDEYKDEHPGVEFTPQSLYELRSQIHKLEVEVAELEKSLADSVKNWTTQKDSYLSGRETNPLSPPPGMRLPLVMEYGDKPTVEGWNNHAGSVVEAMDQLYGMYADLYRANVISPKISQIAILSQIFKDIESGRASNIKNYENEQND